MSKLKTYMCKHGIKRDELIEGANDTAGHSVLYPAKIAFHHRGLELEDNAKEAIIKWLEKEKGLTPAQTTIF